MINPVCEAILDARNEKKGRAISVYMEEKFYEKVKKSLSKSAFVGNAYSCNNVLLGCPVFLTRRPLISDHAPPDWFLRIEEKEE